MTHTSRLRFDFSVVVWDGTVVVHPMQTTSKRDSPTARDPRPNSAKRQRLASSTSTASTTPTTPIPGSGDEDVAMENNYAGFRIPPPLTRESSAAEEGKRAPPSIWAVPRVDLAEVASDPEWFWREYVCRRRPCVIRGLLGVPQQSTDSATAPDGGAGAGAGTGAPPAACTGAGAAVASASDSPSRYISCFEGWDNDRLRRVVGDVEVGVESRDGAGDRFGKGRKAPMKFFKFLDLLESGSESHYLPAQDLPVDADGAGVGLFAPPMDRIAQHLPWRPHILPHLIPQQLNMWMGNARNGSSTGLHHDYHDNLYILLRGRKRFTLFAPSDAPTLHVQGRIRTIHANGLITYHSAPSLRPDGVGADAIAEERRLLAERRLTHAEARLDEARAMPSGDEAKQQAAVASAEAAVAAAEEDLEDALEAALTAQLEQAIGGAADEVDMEYDDDGASMASGAAGDSSATQEGKGGGGGDDDMDGEGSAAAGSRPGVASADPQSFCSIEVEDLHGPAFADKWPEAAALARGEAWVEKGEMLFLPAGWFHEVSSFGDAKEQGHFAVNYWFHPPDNLDPARHGFLHPYKDAYWQRDWNTRFAGRGGLHTDSEVNALNACEVRADAGAACARSNADAQRCVAFASAGVGAAGVGAAGVGAGSVVLCVFVDTPHAGVFGRGMRPNHLAV